MKNKESIGKKIKRKSEEKNENITLKTKNESMKEKEKRNSLTL